jgi:hypothetical protein
VYPHIDGSTAGVLERKDNPANGNVKRKYD